MKKLFITLLALTALHMTEIYSYAGQTSRSGRRQTRRYYERSRGSAATEGEKTLGD